MTTWLNLIAVAAGGAIGSVARYGITLLSTVIPGGSSMLGTTIANVVGCAAIGGLAVYVESGGLISERLALALRVGFLGGLTTFSTFAAESAALAGQERWPGYSVYVGANLLLGWAVLVAASSLMKTWMAS